MVTENDSYYQSHPVTTTKLTYGSIRRKEKKHLSSSTLSKPPRVPKPVLWTPVVDWNNSRLRPGPVCSTPNMTKPHIATSPAIHNLPIGHITSYHPTLSTLPHSDTPAMLEYAAPEARHVVPGAVAGACTGSFEAYLSTNVQNHKKL